MKLNLPNKITIARLILSVIVLVLIGVPWYQLGVSWPILFEVKTTPIELNYILAGVFFLIASVTDFLDGYIARSRNMVTDFGKIKTICMLIGITLALFYNLPFEMFGIWLDEALISVATILSIYSGVQYFLVNKDFIFGDSK